MIEPEELCSAGGCDRPAHYRCWYVDRRRRSCPTRWCAQHAEMGSEQTLCRRHASTIAALGRRAQDPRALPDLEDRGASLIRWIHKEADHRVRARLQQLCADDEKVVSEQAATVVDTPSGRRWLMGWRVFGPHGVRFRAALSVDEGEDSRVQLSVADIVIADGVPPWIEGGHRVTSEDRGDSNDFYGLLERLIDEAVRNLQTA